MFNGCFHLMIIRANGLQLICSLTENRLSVVQHEMDSYRTVCRLEIEFPRRVNVSVFLVFFLPEIKFESINRFMLQIFCDLNKAETKKKQHTHMQAGCIVGVDE